MGSLSWKILLVVFLASGLAAQGASAKLIKVLPHLLDRDDRHTLTPSLFDRDAYQAYLQRHPKERAALRFDVQWKALEKTPLKLRVEMRGVQSKQPTQAVIETPVKPRRIFSTWSRVALNGQACQDFGDLVAWRATLWRDELLLAEQKSFLW